MWRCYRLVLSSLGIPARDSFAAVTEIVALHESKWIRAVWATRIFTNGGILMANVASPAGGLVGNSNYNLYCRGDGGKPEPLTGVTVEIAVTEEMVAVPSAPSVDGEQSNGIGFQLNCCPATGALPHLWQQFMVTLSRTGQSLRWWINNWVDDSQTQVINNGGDLMTIPSTLAAGYARIPGSYRLVMELIHGWGGPRTWRDVRGVGRRQGSGS